MLVVKSIWLFLFLISNIVFLFSELLLECLSSCKWKMRRRRRDTGRPPWRHQHRSNYLDGRWLHKSFSSFSIFFLSFSFFFFVVVEIVFFSFWWIWCDICWFHCGSSTPTHCPCDELIITNDHWTGFSIQWFYWVVFNLSPPLTSAVQHLIGESNTNGSVGVGVRWPSPPWFWYDRHQFNQGELNSTCNHFPLIWMDIFGGWWDIHVNW